MSKRAVLFVAATAIGAWWLAARTEAETPIHVGNGSYSLPPAVDLTLAKDVSDPRVADVRR
jgi:hypothetical protein